MRQTVRDQEHLGECRSLRVLARRAQEAELERFAAIFRTTFFQEEDDELDEFATVPPGSISGLVSTSPLQEREIECPELLEEQPEALPFALEYATVVSGAVRQPGIYPFANNAPLNDMIATAGGISLNGNPRGIELSLSSREVVGQVSVKRQTLSMENPKEADKIVTPGSSITVTARISQQEPGTVSIAGRICSPWCLHCGTGRNYPRPHPAGRGLNRIRLSTRGCFHAGKRPPRTRERVQANRSGTQ